MSWYSFFKLSLVRPFVKVAYKARVEGEENIPATGGAIIACNHTSATETYVLPALIKRQVTYPAKAELFKPGKGIKGIPKSIIAWALKAVGQVPLDRFGGRAALDGLGPVLEVLRDRPGTQHVVITGRDAPPALIEAADLVTEMTKVKHPMDAGRKGQKGLEW